MSSQGPLKTTLAGNFARIDLKTYAAELPLGTLTVGVDNIHHDVYLSPAWTEQTRAYLLEFIRQAANLTYSVRKGGKPPKGPETGAWKRQTLELMQASLTRAKYEKKIELDLLFRVALLEISDSGDRSAVCKPASGGQGMDPHPRRVLRAVGASACHEGAPGRFAG